MRSERPIGRCGHIGVPESVPPAPQRGGQNALKRVLAKVMNVPDEDISIKATTNEKLGFVGREEGLVAYATVMLQKGSIT